MKKTKVVCTMGPNTNDKEVMRKLIQFFWTQRDRKSVQVF